MKIYKILIVGVFALFFLINCITLNDGHNWGDDFAQYIGHALNLVEHKPYASGISLDLRVIPPPGFPLLLSSVIYWTGIDFKVLKSLNIILWALSAIAVYGIALSFLDVVWASLIGLWFLFCPSFFFFKQNVLTDIPFTCFVLLSIWTFMKAEAYQKNRRRDSSWIWLVVSIFCMSYALLIRWAGVLLILSVVVYDLWVNRRWRRPLAFCLGGLAAWMIALQFGSLSMGYADRTTIDLLGHALSISWYNAGLTFQNILSLFIANDHFFTSLITPVNYAAFNIVLGTLFFCLSGLFLRRFCQRRVTLMGCYAFIYLVCLVFWPINAGTRYLLPIMAPLAIFLVRAIKPTSRKWAMVLIASLIVQNVYVIASNFKFNDDAIYTKDSLEMERWVKDHVKADETYMFSKPRALGLLSERIGHNFGAYPQDTKNWFRRIKPLHINYLILERGFSQFNQLMKK